VNCGRPLKFGEVDICKICEGRKTMKQTVEDVKSHEERFDEVFEK